MDLEIIQGEGEGEEPTKPTDHLASLCALWEAESNMAMLLEKLAKKKSLDARARGRLGALAAGAQAHASRLLARIAGLGRPAPLPVPAGIKGGLEEAAEWMDALAAKYALVANLSRKQQDPSAAWVCELNRAECLDAAFEIKAMIQRLHPPQEESCSP